MKGVWSSRLSSSLWTPASVCVPPLLTWRRWPPILALNRSAPPTITATVSTVSLTYWGSGSTWRWSYCRARMPSMCWWRIPPVRCYTRTSITGMRHGHLRLVSYPWRLRSSLYHASIQWMFRYTYIVHADFKYMHVYKCVQMQQIKIVEKTFAVSSDQTAKSVKLFSIKVSHYNHGILNHHLHYEIFICMHMHMNAATECSSILHTGSWVLCCTYIPYLNNFNFEKRVVFW